MPGIQTKWFIWIAFHRFPLTINKITWSLTIFIDFNFYLLASPGSNYMLTWGYFERAADLNHEKLGKIKKPGQCRPSEEVFKEGFKEKRRFFKKGFFKKSDNKLFFFLRLSIATQLSTNSLFAWNQFSIFGWPEEQNDVSSDKNRWNR